MNTNVNEEIENILDCFTGADGGISFIMFRTLMEQLKDEDTDAARQLEHIVRQFSTLIDVANSNNKRD